MALSANAVIPFILDNPEGLIYDPDGPVRKYGDAPGAARCLSPKARGGRIPRGI